MNKNIKLGIILTLIFILAAVQMILPGTFADKIKTGLENQLRGEEKLQVEVDVFPAFKVLWGRIDELRVRGKEITAEGLKIEDVEAVFKDLKVEKKKEEWFVSEGENTYLYLRLLEEDLNNYLESHPDLKIFKRFKVELTSSNQVIITGLISFFSAKVNLQLSGNFEVANSRQVVFKSDKLAVENVVVPTEIIRELKNKLQFTLDLSKLPLPIKVKEVKVTKDKLEVFGVNGE